MDGLLPHRQPQVQRNESDIAFHSRRTLSGHLDEYIFKAGLLEMNVGEFKSLLVNPFDQIDKRGSWAARMDGERAAGVVWFRKRCLSPSRSLFGNGREQVTTMLDAVRLCACSLRGVSMAMIRPSSTMATRSQRRSASSM